MKKNEFKHLIMEIVLKEITVIAYTVCISKSFIFQKIICWLIGITIIPLTVIELTKKFPFKFRAS